MNSTLNKLVACTPFPKQNMEKVVKGGFAMIDKKVQLQELEVVMFGEGFQPGDRVFVRGDATVQAWAKEVFTFDDVEFILVPSSFIQYVKGGAKWQSGC